MKYNYARLFHLICLCAWLLSACKKDKLDHARDNRIIKDGQENSGVRLVNTNGYNQVIVNGDTLTNYVVITDPPEPGTNPWEYPGTRFFPKNGKLGNTWYLPRSLLLQDGTATVKVDIRSAKQAAYNMEFKVQEDYNLPMDYYLLKTKEEPYIVESPPSVVAVPRGVIAPARPDHFKIRVVNMAARLTSQFQDVENVALPLTLTWADGTRVNPATSNIAPGHYSEYIELPYGTCQFKLLTPSGTQVTAMPYNFTEGIDVIDPATSTITRPASGRPHTVTTALTFAPVMTYQPGGIYTIYIAPKTITIPYYNGNPGETVTMVQNAFDVITDASLPLNNTYARVQWVNALPGSKGLSLRLNGQKLGAAPAFGEVGEYAACIVGSAELITADAAGKPLATLSYALKEGLNYTAWVHEDTAGKVAITMVSNNLSGTYTRVGDNGQDATYSAYKKTYPFDIRFMNFCKDLPYVTFTEANGQSFGNRLCENLQPGIVPFGEIPYIGKGAASPAYEVKVYRSSPQVVPGTWLSDIPSIPSRALIAQPELYVRGTLPMHEPGIYTIALIGGYKQGTPAGEKARMIIVKHTK
ncbi:hypothetical protein [Chitinophaga defluvii]|uniref:DUF4397 domain-containing protein n=1 Tax=Chitinophaga defluvii TaxID=3163343 RepID=A0ABV2T1T5_9BACT